MQFPSGSQRCLPAATRLDFAYIQFTPLKFLVKQIKRAGSFAKLPARPLQQPRKVVRRRGCRFRTHPEILPYLSRFLRRRRRGHPGDQRAMRRQAWEAPVLHSGEIRLPTPLSPDRKRRQSNIQLRKIRRWPPITREAAIFTLPQAKLLHLTALRSLTSPARYGPGAAGIGFLRSGRRGGQGTALLGVRPSGGRNLSQRPQRCGLRRTAESRRQT